MEFTRRSLFGSFAGIATSGVAISSHAKTVGVRSTEISAIRAFAERTHPLGLVARSDASWQASWRELEATADSLSDGAYFISIRRALGWFKDGHTTILPFEFVGGLPKPLEAGPLKYRLPLRVQVFYDAAVVASAGEQTRPLLGARLESVGTLDVRELIRRGADRWPGSRIWGHRWAGLQFSRPEFLRALGAIDDPSRPVALTSIAADGQKISIDCSPVSGDPGQLAQFERSLTAVEQWLKDAGGLNFVKRVPNSDLLLLGIEEMSDQTGKTFETFTGEALTAMANSSVRRLAIDLRRNGGGNNFLFETLRKSILVSRFNRPGGLFVLTGPRTFSAAQNLANRLERDSLALFAGEPTGGAPNHHGDAQSFTGPSTGITVIVSTLSWSDSYPMDRRENIVPEIMAHALYEDWRAGRDLCLERVLAYRTADSGPQAMRARDTYFERPSQKAAWTPFWAA